VLAPDRDRHAPDADGDGVAAEWTEMEGLDLHTLIKTELAQAASLTLIERSPINRSDAGGRAQRQTVETYRIGMEGRVHYCE
jgi:hypothetical protein